MLKGRTHLGNPCMVLEKILNNKQKTNDLRWLGFDIPIGHQAPGQGEYEINNVYFLKQ